MSTTGSIVPFKTPEGQDELAHRTRRLGQRYRTLLLLVDGRRSVDQVLALALAAGVAESQFRELLTLGLLALPDDALTAPTLPGPLDGPLDTDDGPASVVHVELPIAATPDGELAWPIVGEAAAPSLAPTPVPGASVDATETVSGSPLPASCAPDLDADSPAAMSPAESELPSAQSLLPDSTSSDFGRHGGAAPPPSHDGPLEEAREILTRAVRTEAPVAGQLTLLKIKRASGRAELEELLDEVEARISRPRKMIVAAQTIRHVRHLLGMPTSTSFTML